MEVRSLKQIEGTYGVVALSVDLSGLGTEKTFPKSEIGGAGMTGILLLIPLGIGIWVYNDAMKRGKTRTEAITWLLGVFLLLIICLPMWLITRPKLHEEVEGDVEKPKLCVHCGKYYEEDPSFCPNCGHSLKEKNEYPTTKETKVETDKKHCPFCNHPLSENDIMRGACPICHKVF